MIRQSILAKTLTLISILMLGIVVFGHEWEAPAKEKAKKNPIKADDKSVALGKDLYEKKCLSCHGDTGKGDGKMAAMLKEHPGDLTQIGSQSDGEVFWKISTGKEPMPGLGKVLSADERWHIVNYVRTLAKKK